MAPFVEYFYEHNILYIHMSTNALNAHFKIFVQLSLNLETIYNYSTFVVLLNLITGLVFAMKNPFLEMFQKSFQSLREKIT